MNNFIKICACFFFYVVFSILLTQREDIGYRGVCYNLSYAWYIRSNLIYMYMYILYLHVIVFVHVPCMRYEEGEKKRENEQEGG